MEIVAGAAIKTVCVSKIIPTLGFKCSLQLTAILGDDFGRGVLESSRWAPTPALMASMELMAMAS